jgi:hypothetical protein
MRWIFPCLLLFTSPARAVELLRDDHFDCSYVFESEAKDVIATVTRADVIRRANEWAARFYKNSFIQFERIEFRTTPTRFWLVAFGHSDTGKTFYAAILPDGTIAVTKVEERI